MKVKTTIRGIEGYPRVMGTEQETGLIFKLQSVDRWLELDEFRNDFFETRVNADDEAHSLEFLANGMRVYSGGAICAKKSTNLERATPECSSPTQLTSYIAGSDLYLERLIEYYVPFHNSVLASSGDYTPIEDVRYHRRVRDSEGNTKACHDSYDVHFYKKTRTLEIVKKLITAHTVTRPIVTGSGYVDEDDGAYYYGQKMSNVSDIEKKAYASNLFYECDTLTRLEIRCGDQCVSDWATWMRVGSAALVIALAGTPLGLELLDRLDHSVSKYQSAIQEESKRANRHKDRESNIASATIQEILATYALDKLQLYRELPQEYFNIANEWYQYIEDYKKVLNGYEDVAILADRSDWASKFEGIMSRINRDNITSRRLGDYESLMHDQTFDMIKYHYDYDKMSKVYGWGFKKYQKIGRKVLKQNDIARALKHPPETRARIRSELIKAYGDSIDDAYWDRITFEGVDPESYMSIDFSSNPLEPTISRNGLYVVDQLKSIGVYPTTEQ